MLPSQGSRVRHYHSGFPVVHRLGRFHGAAQRIPLSRSHHGQQQLSQQCLLIQELQLPGHESRTLHRAHVREPGRLAEVAAVHFVPQREPQSLIQQLAHGLYRCLLGVGKFLTTHSSSIHMATTSTPDSRASPALSGSPRARAQRPHARRTANGVQHTRHQQILEAPVTQPRRDVGTRFLSYQDVDESGGSRGRVAASNVDRLTSHLLQLWRQVQDEVARVGHALISWLAGCSGVAVVSAWLVFPSKSSETHYGGSSSEFPTGCRRTTLSQSCRIPSAMVSSQKRQRHRLFDTS
ncbi:hypothetical protein PRNP1_011119 [Phytophthora ramorum]